MRTKKSVLTFLTLCLVSLILEPIRSASSASAQNKNNETLRKESSRASARGRVNVLTQAYGPERTGANLNETTLTPRNVDRDHFGKLFTRTVDGHIYAEPLLVSNLTIPGKGTHNVVFIETEHNSVYCYDADDPVQSDPLWHVNLGTPVPAADVGAGFKDMVAEIGITATPVIDPSTSTMYVVTKNKDGSGYHQRLHALDIYTGNEKSGSPVEIVATVNGTAADGSGGKLSFNPLMQLNRPGLLISNNTLYLGFGSLGDVGVWHGWLMAYDPATLSQKAVFCTTPDGDSAGIWGAGQGLVTDSTGNIYVATGNGTYSASSPGGGDYGDSVVKLSPSLSVIDWFAPADQDFLDKNDLDLGSGGPLLLPGTSLLAICGKDGMLRLIDTNTMGRFDPSTDNDEQEFQAVSGRYMGRPIYWNSPDKGPVIFIWGEGDILKEYRFDGSQFQQSPSSQSTMAAQNGYANSVPLALSADGTSPGTGIVWASCPEGADANHQTVHGILRAFDASDLSKELWNSEMNISRDDVGNYAKFCPPVIANGKVYEASFSGVLNVYGLLGNQCIVLNQPSASFGTPGGNGSISFSGGSDCTWTAASNASWISITSQSGGQGSGSIDFTVAENEGPSRSGAITVANSTFNISQTSGCWFDLPSDTFRFGPNGGSSSFSITASDPGCQWTAKSSTPWISITSATSGSGSATITFSVAKKKKNRTGTITIDGGTVTITQQKNPPAG